MGLELKYLLDETRKKYIDAIMETDNGNIKSLLEFVRS